MTKAKTEKTDTLTMQQAIEHVRKLAPLEVEAIRAYFLEPDADNASDIIQEADLCFDNGLNIGNYPLSGDEKLSAAEQKKKQAMVAEHVERKLFSVSRFDDGGEPVFWAIVSRVRPFTHDAKPQPELGYIIRNHPEYGTVISGVTHLDTDALSKKKFVWSFDASQKEKFNPLAHQALETTDFLPLPS